MSRDGEPCDPQVGVAGGGLRSESVTGADRERLGGSYGRAAREKHEGRDLNVVTAAESGARGYL